MEVGENSPILYRFVQELETRPLTNSECKVSGWFITDLIFSDANIILTKEVVGTIKNDVLVYKCENGVTIRLILPRQDENFSRIQFCLPTQEVVKPLVNLAWKILGEE